MKIQVTQSDSEIRGETGDRREGEGEEAGEGGEAGREGEALAPPTRPVEMRKPCTQGASARSGMITTEASGWALTRTGRWDAWCYCLHRRGSSGDLECMSLCP